MKGHNESYTYCHEISTGLGVSPMRPNPNLPNPIDAYCSRGWLHNLMQQNLDVAYPSDGLPGDTCYTYSKKDMIPPCSGITNRPPHHLKPIKKFNTDKEREDFLRWCELRAERPYYERKQDRELRYPKYYHFALDLLHEGHHRAFTEYFDLICQQESIRERHPAEGDIWQITPISCQPDKLLRLKNGLSKAEDARLKKDFISEYNAYEELVSFFEDHPDDKWLLNYFLLKCLDAGENMKTHDNGIGHVHAILRMVVHKINIKDLSAAEYYLRMMIRLTEEHFDWEDSNQKSYFIIACEMLNKLLLERCRSQIDHQQKIDSLLEVKGLAKRANDTKLLFDLLYLLGKAYYGAKKFDACIEKLSEFITQCKKRKDWENLARGSQLISKAYNRIGDGEKALQYQQDYVYLTEQLGQESNYLRAMRDHANLLFRNGKYAEANMYFSHAFKKHNEHAPPKNFSEENINRAFVGVTSAYQFNSAVSAYIVDNSKYAIQTLIKWKSSICNAKDIFVLPIPDE